MKRFRIIVCSFVLWAMAINVYAQEKVVINGTKAVTEKKDGKEIVKESTFSIVEEADHGGRKVFGRVAAGIGSQKGCNGIGDVTATLYLKAWGKKRTETETFTTNGKTRTERSHIYGFFDVKARGAMNIGAKSEQEQFAENGQIMVGLSSYYFAGAAEKFGSYFGLDAGYGCNLNHSDYRGFALETEIGVVLFKKLTVGYAFNKQTLKFHGEGAGFKQKVHTHMFRLGVFF